MSKWWQNSDFFSKWRYLLKHSHIHYSYELHSDCITLFTHPPLKATCRHDRQGDHRVGPDEVYSKHTPSLFFICPFLNILQVENFGQSIGETATCFLCVTLTGNMRWDSVWPFNKLEHLTHFVCNPITSNSNNTGTADGWRGAGDDILTRLSRPQRKWGLSARSLAESRASKCHHTTLTVISLF